MPVAFLLYLLVLAHESGIRVANNEMAGVPVIETALGLAGVVVAFDLPEDAPRVRSAAQAALVQFDDATGHSRGTRDATDVFAAASFKAIAGS